MTALSHDRFLDGRLKIWQPEKGYRAGVDPVFLAAGVAAKSGQSVLELGCGVGVASFCLGWRVSGLDQTGVELQSNYAELAARNARENSIGLKVLVGDLADLPAPVLMQSFDHVIANPPYYRRESGTKSKDKGRDIAVAEHTPLSTWVDVATKRLKSGGHLTMILKAERLGDLIDAMDHRLGSIVLKPMVPRQGRDAELVLVRARKGARGVFRLASPLVLHRGDRHEKDTADYSDLAQNILRNGAALGAF